MQIKQFITITITITTTTTTTTKNTTSTTKFKFTFVRRRFSCSIKIENWITELFKRTFLVL